MLLVIDDKIPYMRGFAERLGEVRYLPGNAISAADVKDADVLIVRTRTRCNEALLGGSHVRFIATATIGYDHIDADYLRRAGIEWTNCPGCNARSVKQYVGSAIRLLLAHGAFHPEVTGPLSALSADGFRAGRFNEIDLGRLTIGIVGEGHVGSQIHELARELGFGRILVCDPPRAEREGTAGFVGLEEIAREADIVSFHTPLTRKPQPYPTYHIADRSFFNQLKPGAVLLNTSRGEVVDTEAIKEALRSGRLRTAVIDTWENEPQIDRELLQMVFLATPHIAGYSADGKACGTRMALQAVARHFGLDPVPFDAVEAPAIPTDFCYYPEGPGRTLDPALQLYDPTRDAAALTARPEQFEALRGNYPLRRERF